MPDEMRRAGETVATPQGDNESAPDQPLTPADVAADLDGIQSWPSNSAMEEDKKPAAAENHPDHHTGLREIIDEISTGKILP